MRQRVDSMKKSCLFCGGEMIQPRWKNGKLDSTFRKRKFCSIQCSGSWVEAQNLCQRSSGRKRAQRKYALTACMNCGNGEAIGRVAVGVKNRVDRLKAIGNGQVPLCMAYAFSKLSEGIIGDQAVMGW